MKKLLFAIIAVVTFAGFVSSCSSDDDNVASNYELNVNLVLPSGVSVSDLTSGSVVVTNEQTGRSYPSDEVNASYGFKLPGGTYTVQVSMRANNGVRSVSYSASKSISVYENTNVSLDLAEGIIGGFVFKEVYYNMVKPNGKTPYMRDQFFEIYNNSDEVLYLDNCILGILEGSQGMLPTSWMENGEIMKEYALGYYTVAFVGNGTTYPVEPGKSVVIASQAQNHTAETEAMYDGSVEGALKSPVDLSKADYEVFLGDYKPAVAIDNPDVPNMTVIYANGTQNYFTVPYTGNAIILAKLPEGVDPISFANNPANLKARPDGTLPSSTFLMIPQEYVLDGLNIVNNADKASQRVIRLRAEVDAGMVFMNAPYMGKSIRRKVEKVENGRVILKDTNNSTEDFLSDQEPTPGLIPSN